jgi:hypothetical protein
VAGVDGDAATDLRLPGMGLVVLEGVDDEGGPGLVEGEGFHGGR